MTHVLQKHEQKDRCDALTSINEKKWQAEIVNRLIDGKFLTDDERDVLRWGRNANKSLSPKRAITLAKGDYRKSTAFECLVRSFYVFFVVEVEFVYS